MKEPVNDCPLVSVGVPVFNEEKHVRKILQSIHLQKYPNMEVLISDNASTDQTWDIVTEFVNNDSRFKGVRQPENIGASENFMHVLKEAKGELFIWAGGQDLWGPDMIDSLVSMFQMNPSMVLCAPRTKWIDEEDNVLFEKDVHIDTRSARSPAGRVRLLLEQMERCNAIYGLHRRETLLKTIPWPHGSDDFTGLCRIASLGDVITEDNAYWCRRNLNPEAVSERMARYARVFNRSGLYAKFPFLIDEMTTIMEMTRFRGGFSDRLRLVLYYLRNWTLTRSRIKSLVSDTLEGLTKR